MAIEKQIETKNLRIKEEITSVETRLGRTIYKNPKTGFYEALYPIEILMESITYELDENNNKIDIYDRKSLGNTLLTAEEIMFLWYQNVTLDDGSKHVLGNLIADKIDAIIAAKLAPPV
jgi:hypothetical protein